MKASELLRTQSCCCLKWRDEAIKVPLCVVVGRMEQNSHRFRSRIFRLPFVVAILDHRNVAAEVVRLKVH